MPLKSATRRKIGRYRVKGADRAKVIFVHPSPNGMCCELPLVDISLAGFSFRLQETLPDLECGASIPDAELQFSDCRIRGDLVIMHLSPGAGPGAVCGALFYPAGDDDLIKLKCVIAGIEALGDD